MVLSIIKPCLDVRQNPFRDTHFPSYGRRPLPKTKKKPLIVPNLQNSGCIFCSCSNLQCFLLIIAKYLELVSYLIILLTKDYKLLGRQKSDPQQKSFFTNKSYIYSTFLPTTLWCEVVVGLNKVMLTHNSCPVFFIISTQCQNDVIFHKL